MDPRFQGPNGTWAGGPSNRQKNYASQLNERDALISSYEHLTGMPTPGDALLRLRKIASLVKPIMRKRNWNVQILTEFLPEDPRLLGLNINQGYKICIRLRYTHAPGTFLPIEQCIDTMLHELSHIIFGPHDASFNALWDELRDEHETLLLKGYTGEGFLTKGQRLGGGPVPPPHEVRRIARVNVEQRRTLKKESGQRLGGRGIRAGDDPRKVIAGAIERRNIVNRGCASNDANAGNLASQPGMNTTRTKAEEDDANDRAIAEALLELWEEEENRKLNQTYATAPSSGGLTWTPEGGLSTTPPPPTRQSTAPLPQMNEDEQLKWALEESLRAINPGPSKPQPQHFSQSQPPSKPPTRSLPLPPQPIIDPTPPSPAAKRPKLTPTTSTNNPRTNPPPGPGVPISPVPVQAPRSAPPLSPRRKPVAATPAATTETQPETESWICEICTLSNPLLYLSCGACGIERPAAVKARTAAAALQRVERGALRAGLVRPETLGWCCERCGTFMEHKFWTCSVCGLMKGSSRVSEHAL